MTEKLNLRTCRRRKSILRLARRILYSFACRGGVVIALAVQGCAVREESEVKYVRVEVPVQVPCRAPEVAVPAWAAAGLRRTDSLEVKVRALLAERRQWIGYARQLAAASAACN